MVFGSPQTSSSFDFPSLSKAHQEEVSQGEGATPGQTVVEAAAFGNSVKVLTANSSDNDESLLEDAVRSASQSSEVQLAQQRQCLADMLDSGDYYFQYLQRNTGDNEEELTEVVEVAAEFPCFRESAVSEASFCSSADWGYASTDGSCSEQASDVDPDDVDAEGAENIDAALNQLDVDAGDDYAESVYNIDAAPEPPCSTPNQFDLDSDHDYAEGADNMDAGLEPRCPTPDQFASWYGCESPLHSASAAWRSQEAQNLAMCPPYYQAAVVWAMFVAVPVAPLALPVVSSGPSHEHLAPRSLSSFRDEERGACSVQWRISRQQLDGRDKTVLSPGFELQVGGSETAAFKILIKPKQLGLQRQQQCFRKSKGMGLMEVKCESSLSTSETYLQLKFTVGEGHRSRTRDAVEHDFSSRSLASLPESDADWDFWAAMDPDSKSVLVTLEIAPAAAARPLGSRSGQPNEAAHSEMTSVHASCEATTVASSDCKHAEANSSALSRGHRATEQMHGSTVSLAETRLPYRRRRSESGQRKQRERHFRRLAERRAKQLAGIPSPT